MMLNDSLRVPSSVGFFVLMRVEKSPEAISLAALTSFTTGLVRLCESKSPITKTKTKKPDADIPHLVAHLADRSHRLFFILDRENAEDIFIAELHGRIRADQFFLLAAELRRKRKQRRLDHIARALPFLHDRQIFHRAALRHHLPVGVKNRLSLLVHHKRDGQPLFPQLLFGFGGGLFHDAVYFAERDHRHHRGRDLRIFLVHYRRGHRHSHIAARLNKPGRAPDDFFLAHSAERFIADAGQLAVADQFRAVK